MIHIDNDWQPLFDVEQRKPYYLALRAFLKNEYATKTIYPPMNDIFTAFRLTSFEKTKVIIVGQDPYHEEGQAMGLAFLKSMQLSVRASISPVVINVLSTGVMLSALT